MREIADLVGMTQAGVLHHFAHKAELLQAVLTLRDEEAYGVVGMGGTVSGLDVLRGLLRLIDHNTREPGIVELYCTLSAEATITSHPAHNYFKDRYSLTVDTITAAYDDMLAKGELIAGVRPRSAAVLTVAIMDGLQVQWLLDRGSIDMYQELHGHFQRLANVPIDPIGTQMGAAALPNPGGYDTRPAFN
jgi:AcrR family transcriptional regulator